MSAARLRAWIDEYIAGLLRARGFTRRRNSFALAQHGNFAIVEFDLIKGGPAFAIHLGIDSVRCRQFEQYVPDDIDPTRPVDAYAASVNFALGALSVGPLVWSLGGPDAEAEQAAQAIALLEMEGLPFILGLTRDEDLRDWMIERARNGDGAYLRLLRGLVADLGPAELLPSIEPELVAYERDLQAERDTIEADLMADARAQGLDVIQTRGATIIQPPRRRGTPGPSPGNGGGPR